LLRRGASAARARLAPDAAESRMAAYVIDLLGSVPVREVAASEAAGGEREQRPLAVCAGRTQLRSSAGFAPPDAHHVRLGANGDRHWRQLLS
jgi:hypothetical protein